MITPKLNAQEEIQAEYDRIGLTVLFYTYGGKFENKLEDAMKDVSFPDKFYQNKLKECVISLPRSMEMKDESLAQDDEQERIEIAREYLKEQNIGRKIVEEWYNFDPEQGFDLSMIFERAEYNATDEEIIVSEGSKRGRARIRDYGHELVSNSYVAIVDLRDLKKETEREKDYASVSYSSDMGLYIFKLKFGEEQINELFDVWIFEDDSPEEKEQKLARFKEMDFPLELVYSKPDWLLPTGTASYGGLDGLTGKKLDMSVLDKEAFEKFYNEIFDKMMFHASKHIQDFTVRKKVTDVRPIQAKIGLRESLKTDDQYFVYEYVWDEQLKEAIPKRKAVLRVRKVADNRDEGRSAESSFYQTYGGTVREGMLVKEHPNVGLALNVGYEMNGLGGFGVGLRYRIGRYIDIPALYLITGLSGTSEDYGNIDKENFKYLSKFKEDQVFFMRYDLGFGKGFRIARFIELMPFAVGGYNQTESDQDGNKYASFYYKAGLTAAVNVLYNLQLYGSFNYYGLGGVSKIDGDDIDTDEDALKWADEFPGQEGGTGIQFGLSYEF
ncbi:MAG: hypothetical protein K9G67_09450 [Bacteroidales bacterium]|nr:hypothetical protein [Bacteroidales bacterium]MCF8376567.1 hypothetical protein [Bacteroidales bacterium]